MNRFALSHIACLILVAASTTVGQEVRYRTERTPIAPQRIEETERTVYRDRIVTEMRDSYRPVYTPITEYHMEPRWHNWWNPFGRPYVAYHMRPRTHWETRYQRYQVPVTYRETVPVTERVQVVTRQPQIIEREIVERVVVSPTTPRVAHRAPLTRAPAESQWGSARLDNDPPRHSTTTRRY